jgi:hypothetical protein
LRHYILQHYEAIFRHEPQRLARWHDHLLSKIVETSANHDAVLVEGYLLYDCKDKFSEVLEEQSIRSFRIKAEPFRYVLEHELVSVEEIAALGTSDPQSV